MPHLETPRRTGWFARVRRSDSARARRALSLRPWLEGLEQKALLATISWNATAAPDGGSWHVGSNWTGGQVPVNGDSVVINLARANAEVTFNQNIEVNLASITINSVPSLRILDGEISVGTGISTVANVTVGGGAAFEVPANGRLTVRAGSAITVAASGELDLGPGSTLTLARQNFAGATSLIVNGMMTANGATITQTGTGSGSSSPVTMSSGATLNAIDTTFATSSLTLEDGSVLTNGQFKGNRLDVPLYVPAAHVPLLSEGQNINRRFQDVNILAGNISSGTTLELGLIGSETTANLRYIFSDNFKVDSGAALLLEANTKAEIAAGKSLTIDGAFDLEAGSTLTLERDFGSTTRLTVNGMMTATGATVTQTTASSSSAQITINSGATLNAIDTTFATTSLTLADGSILTDGQFKGNRFDLPIFVPAEHIPLLSEGQNVNRRFQDVNILAGNISSGTTLELGLIGSETTANLRYIFSDNFKVDSGAALLLEANTKAEIAAGKSLTIDGAFDLEAGSSLTMTRGSFTGTTALIVNGALTATSATITQSGVASGSNAPISINSNATLHAIDTTFSAERLNLDYGSIVIDGSLQANRFDLPLYVPASHIPLLSKGQNVNRRFQDVNLLLGSIPGGTTLDLGLIGSETTANLRYIFFDNFEVEPNARLVLGSDVKALIAAGKSLTIDGAFDLESGSSLTMTRGSFTGTTALIVNGALTATSATITQSGVASGSNAPITVNSGGSAELVGATLTAERLTFGSGSSGTLSASVLSGILSLHSNTTLDIHGNDFSQVGANGVVAVGDQSATIDLKGNYWGTSVVSNIEAKILDRGDESNRPDIVFSPFVTSAGETAAVPASATYRQTDQNVTLVANVAPNGMVVNTGQVVFTILQGDTPIGNPTAPAAVTNSQATATYTLPARTAPGSYTIRAVYTDASGNFLTAIDTSQKLTVNKASVSIVAQDDSTSYHPTVGQTITLRADLTTAAGVVDEGEVIFRIQRFGADVVAPIIVGVGAGGLATEEYTLPPDLAAANYVIRATYSGGPSFLTATDTATLDIDGVPTTTTASNASVQFIANTGRTVVLTATVASAVGVVEGGTVRFRILRSGDGTQIGPTVFGQVNAGAAQATYTMPGNTPVGDYVIQAVYQGNGDFLASAPDDGHLLTVTRAPGTVLTTDADTTYNANAGSTVNLSALVNTPDGPINEGTITFTIYQGVTVIGSPIIVNVSAGVATGAYLLPSNLAGGQYTIESVFSGGTNYLGFTDRSGVLFVGTASTSTPATQGVTVFNALASASVNLSTTVTSPGGIVDFGTVTFTVLSGATVIGTPITVNVSAGVATGSYAIPVGLAAGNYTIRTTYNGTTNFGTFTNNGGVLIINAAASTVAVPQVNTLFNGLTGQAVNLRANLSSLNGSVDGGQLTFRVLSGGVLIGTPVTVNVSAGVAIGSYLLPTGLGAGSYVIESVFGGSSNFAGFTSTGTLVINATASATAVSGASLGFSGLLGQSANLSATVTSTAGIVSGGTVTFRVLDGTTLIGTATSIMVNASGVAQIAYALPAGLAAGTYKIEATYNGSTNFEVSTSTSNLVVTASASSVLISNATSYLGGTGSSVELNASIISSVGIVSAGQATFTILSGTTVIGTPVSVNIVAGQATATYGLPTGLAPGSYTIQVGYGGSNNFLASSSTAGTLTVRGLSVVTSASASAVFTTTTQSVSLSATVNGPAGPIGSGSLTFRILAGSTLIGNPVTVNVSAGSATANYALPTGLVVGAYTVEASYAGTGFLDADVDTTGVLTISAASTSTVSVGTTLPYSGLSQSVALSASVFSPRGTVSEGLVSFSIFSNATLIAGPIAAEVVGGEAATSLPLPAGLAAGSYTIQASFGDGVSFAESTAASQTLIITSASTQVSSGSTTSLFATAASTVSLSANVTSAAGTVNEGDVLFEILANGSVVGTARTDDVSGGLAQITYTLPAGFAVGTYAIRVSYQGTTTFLTSTDASALLTVRASTVVSTSSLSIPFESSSRTVTLAANVNSNAGTVDRGAVTFRILNNGTVVGTPRTFPVENGQATGTYSIPAGLGVGAYAIEATYNGFGGFLGAVESSHFLTVTEAATTTTALDATAAFSGQDRQVSVRATVISPGGDVTTGLVRFQLFQGTNPVGAIVDQPINSGIATTNYPLPAGLAVGGYTLRARYLGSTSFGISTDEADLNVTVAPTTTTVSAATATFRVDAQAVALQASVTSASGTVNGGELSFRLFSGANPIGVAVPATVTNGTATANYTLPAGLAPGQYTIRADYAGTANLSASSQAVAQLMVSAAATTTTTNNLTLEFSDSARSVELVASVTSPAGVVSTGNVTFRLLSGGTLIGVATPGTINGGEVRATYVLPAGLASGAYTVQAQFAGQGGFGASAGAGGVLTISPPPVAPTTTGVEPTITVFTESAQFVRLNATVTAPGQVVSAGTVTFEVLAGGTVLGTSVTANVVAGQASVDYLLPAGSLAGAYAVRAQYSGAPGLSASSITASGALSAENPPVAVTALGPIDDYQPTPLGFIDVQFSRMLVPGSFGPEDLVLTRNGSPVPVTGAVITPLAANTFRVSNLGAFTASYGSYTLSVNAAGVLDSAGKAGAGQATATFRRGLTPADYDGDGISDRALYEVSPTGGQFRIELSSGAPALDVPLGTPGSIPIDGDFDGDGLSDMAVVQPNFDNNGDGNPDFAQWLFIPSKLYPQRLPVVFDFGAPGSLDRPAPADYDGDGKTDIATFRANSDLTPGAAEWFILGSTAGPFRLAFGAANGVDLPAPADLDGDGADDIVAFRPVPHPQDADQSSAQWFVLPSSLNDPTFSARAGAFPVVYGARDNLDQPAPADFDGDGRADVVNFRSISDLPDAAGRADWFLLQSSRNTGRYDQPIDAQRTSFGRSGDLAVTGDFDGDGISDLAQFTQADGRWTYRPSRTGQESTIPGTIAGANVVPVRSPLYFRLRATGNLPPTVNATANFASANLLNTATPTTPPPSAPATGTPGLQYASLASVPTPVPSGPASATFLSESLPRRGLNRIASRLRTS